MAFIFLCAIVPRNYFIISEITPTLHPESIAKSVHLDMRFHLAACELIGRSTRAAVLKNFNKMEENRIIVLHASDLEAIIKKTMQGLLEQKEEPAVDRLLTVSQAAAMLGVSRTTLWRWKAQKYLVPESIGGRLRYRESNLLKRREYGI